MPHSGISGSTPADGSPKLFAAFHALHRLVTPRHPPCAFPSSAPHSRTTPSRQDRLCSSPLFCFQRARKATPHACFRRPRRWPVDLGRPTVDRSPQAHHPGSAPDRVSPPLDHSSRFSVTPSHPFSPNKNGPTPSDRHHTRKCPVQDVATLASSVLTALRTPESRSSGAPLVPGARTVYQPVSHRRKRTAGLRVRHSRAWWRWADSNPRPPACKAGALPLSYSPVAPRSLRAPRVGVPGIEPGTSVLSGLRSNRLSYTPGRAGLNRRRVKGRRE